MYERLVELERWLEDNVFDCDDDVRAWWFDRWLVFYA